MIKMVEQYTIKELYIILGELIADGYGNREFQLWYDSECAYTSIPKGSSITLINKAVRFTDYDDGKCHLTEEMMNMINKNEGLKEKIHHSVKEAEKVECCCNPCVVEEYVKKAIGED